MVPSAEIIYLLVGPMITLVYPLYASIRAIEGISNGDIQQWLTYWVLFTLIRLVESLLGKLLEWLLIWPFAKVTITLWLVLPYFGGAAHVYEHYVRLCASLNLQNLYAWIISGNEDYTLSSSSSFFHAAEKYILENGPEALAEIVSKGKNKAPNLSKKDMEPPWQEIPKKAQREWTCTLCVVTTTSEKDLRTHLQGKKHKTKEELENNIMSKHKGGLVVDLIKDLKRHIDAFARPIRWCTWEKPELGWTKLNTDGSKDLKKASLGGLLRDHSGSAICAFVSKAPRVGIFALELWAIWRGLILALGQGVTALWIESDSMSVVKVINKEWPYPMKDARCLKKIWELLKKFEKYKVSHSLREANRAADHLAKMNVNGNDVVLWPGNFPNSLRGIIKEDAEGKIYLRH